MALNNVFEKLSTDTLALADSNIEKISQLFPSCITEVRDDAGKLKKMIRFEVLKELLAGDLADTEEFYEMMFVGKQKARQQAHLSLKGKTLRPYQEESVDWDSTRNLYIEGDNLEVMKLMLKGYMGKIKMIYIDPPYNTGKDFVYPDNFSMSQRDYEKEAGRLDAEGKRQVAGVELEGARHSDWCRFMYERLYLAKDLLSDDGVIFISIDDNEVDNLKKICNEIFGGSNFIASIIWQKKTGASDAKGIATITEYLIVFLKNNEYIGSIFNKNQESYDINRYRYKDDFYDERGPYYIDNLDRGGLRYSDSLNFAIECPDGTLTYPNGRKEFNNDGWTWKWGKQKVEWALQNKFLEFRKSTSKESGWAVCYKNYLNVDNEGNKINRAAPYKNLITDVLNANAAVVMKELFDTNRIFNYTKPVELMINVVKMINSEGLVVLDFFSGSATTAHAVMQLNAEDGGNRKFIMVQIPDKTDEKSEAYKVGYKNICEIGKERIRRAGKKIKSDYGEKVKNLDIGFRVLKVGDDYKKKVEHEPSEYNQDFLDKLESNIKEDRTELDLLFACLVSWGIELHHPYSSERIDGYTVHNYSEGSLVACFDNQIPDVVIRQIAEMKPLRVVFRDSGFIDSAAKINVREIFKMISPGTEIRVL